MADDVVLIDFDDGVKRVMNNKNVYVNLLEKFSKDENFKKMEEALENGDLEQARVLVHTIKGLSANLSLTGLNRQSLELEIQIKAGSVDSSKIAAVKEAYENTLLEIKRIIEEND